MSGAAFTGVIPPLVTPLDDTGEVDVGSLRRLVEWQIDAGVHGVFALGSSGEVGYLDDPRRRAVLETVRDAVAGRVPVLAGVIEMSTQRVLSQVRVAQSLGADALVATAPFYIGTSPAEIERHFRLLAEAATVPLFAYDIPIAVHTKLDPLMLVRLGSDGVLAGVKDSSGDDISFRRLVAANRDAGRPLSIFTGHEVVVDGALLIGADGVVPGLGNVDPAGYVRIFQAAADGDWPAAREEQDRLARLFEILRTAPDVSRGAGGIGAFKTALQHLGVITSARMSEPVISFDQAAAARVRQIVDQVVGPPELAR
ncbi:dihydrodipicolinate synthase family protein [Microlunatus panaciterrae]|uniref:4-hydroxy-tetrahydrodipicolinate synthase n=1 Tax=Microlunatus panaciterrae TaxID=400768 RepID=A0ABS2RI07_9ACTN|nr:4-hydroxy-tetrahydrodipicolinate synthase [Microlunatus panaciterrae]